jgi:hypothetical protein
VGRQKMRWDSSHHGLHVSYTLCMGVKNKQLKWRGKLTLLQNSTRGLGHDS